MAFNKAWLTVKGVISSQPIFAKTQAGLDYCSFALTVVNTRESQVNMYQCLLLAGKQYDQFKKFKIGLGDNIEAQGNFSWKMSKNNKSINHNLFISEFYVLSSAYAREYENVGYVDETRPSEEKATMQKPTTETIVDDDYWGD